MTSFPGRWTRVRILACGVVLIALFAAVGKRAFNLQVGEAEHLRAGQQGGVELE